MTNKQRTKIIVLAVLLCTGLAAAWQLTREQAVHAYNANNLIRFHVIANSNSPADQATKYRVRDSVVSAMSGKFDQVDNIQQARKITRENLDYIQQLAVQEVRAGGKDYPVTIKTGRYMFPARTYQNNFYDFTLSAGEYEAVRVVLGRGVGANWWCVLFPPLCFVDPAGVVPAKKTNTNDSPAAVPAFRLGAPRAVTALGSLKRNEQSPGPAWIMAAPEGEPPVEFRFRILDYFRWTRD